MVKFRKFISNNAKILAILVWLGAANGLYATHNFMAWIVTLGFFCIVPGFLLLGLFRLPKISAWYASSLSLGLSILFLMLAGLVVNQLTIFGVHAPLTTMHIFAGLDVGVLALMACNFRSLRGRLPHVKLALPKPLGESYAVLAAACALPVLTIFGAFRLNNGASNVLTMLAYGLIPLLFLWLLLRPNLEKLYAPVLSFMGLAVLLSVSLRGWHITGHDIQNEFYAFQLTFKNQHWNMANFRDPYNACLSITILPTMIAKITTISSIYVYKAVFQLLFALVLIPIYHFIKLVSNKTVALIGSLIFITFPVFLNDMTMLNRQEIAFIFFALLLLVGCIPNLKRRQRTLLTLTTLLGLVLSHYSSTYVALSMLIVARFAYMIVDKKQLAKKASAKQPAVFMLSWRLLVVALLSTFLWNMQITKTGSGLSQTISTTIQGALGGSGSQSADVSYSLFSTSSQSPVELLSGYASNSGSDLSSVQYVGSYVLPPSTLGRFFDRIGLNVKTINNISKALSAKILQVLLLAGVIIMGVEARRKQEPMAKYLFSLNLAALILLGLQTVLPELSVDYGTLRLFQQLLIVTAIPIVVATVRFMPFKQIRVKYAVAGVCFAVLGLLLTSFIGQALGGYSPVLALSNSGDYYEEYYVHGSELDSANWLLANRAPNAQIDMDQYSGLRFVSAIKTGKLKPEALAGLDNNDYVYQDYANVTTNAYQIDLSATHLRYTLTGNLNNQKDLLYSNGQSKVWR